MLIALVLGKTMAIASYASRETIAELNAGENHDMIRITGRFVTGVHGGFLSAFYLASPENNWTTICSSSNIHSIAANDYFIAALTNNGAAMWMCNMTPAAEASGASETQGYWILDQLNSAKQRQISLIKNKENPMVHVEKTSVAVGKLVMRSNCLEWITIGDKNFFRLFSAVPVFNNETRINISTQRLPWPAALVAWSRGDEKITNHALCSNGAAHIIFSAARDNDTGYFLVSYHSENRDRITTRRLDSSTQPVAHTSAALAHLHCGGNDDAGNKIAIHFNGKSYAIVETS